MNAATTRFLVTAAALGAAHEVGDHWLQTDRQACTKGEPGWPGRRACAAHVASYTALGALAVLGAGRRLGVPAQSCALTAGLAVSALSHYVADRRTPLRWLAARTGSAGYLRCATVVRRPGAGAADTGPGTALFHLDQSWHYGWLFVAALVAAGRPGPTTARG